MLKSTYKPSPGFQPNSLPDGWTEHTAPTGHTYYYNASTKESTYKRPLAPAAASLTPAGSFSQPQAVPALNLSDPNVANAFMAQYHPPPAVSLGSRGRDGGGERRPPPQPRDRPQSAAPIPGCEPWLLVRTKYGRRFAHNPEKGASYWRIPEKLKAGILELDQARIREKAAGAGGGGDGEEGKKSAPAPPAVAAEAAEVGEPPDQERTAQHDYDSSEYEEVEVTDDEGDADGDEEGSARKRLRLAEGDEDTDAGGPVEFTEADIAAQLAAMDAEYGYEAGDGEDGEVLEDDEDDGLPLSEEDARALFKDLLTDFKINPFSPWEKLVEEGRLVDDARYSVLATMKARREVWEEWSREGIRAAQEARAQQERADPRVAFFALLAERANPRLYWAEFRRKHRKEAAMRDAALSDKDREKWYREHVARLKMPQAQLKTDLKKLLEEIPRSQLNNRTDPARLPVQVLTDLRYISLDAKVRDPFVEAYVQTLGPPPEGGDEDGKDDEATKKAQKDRLRREAALRERERAVAEEKREQEKKLRYGKANLRDEERELERAMEVSKKGLHSQLVGDKAVEKTAEVFPTND